MRSLPLSDARPDAADMMSARRARSPPQDLPQDRHLGRDADDCHHVGLLAVSLRRGSQLVARKLTSLRLIAIVACTGAASGRRPSTPTGSRRLSSTLTTTRPSRRRSSQQHAPRSRVRRRTSATSLSRPVALPTSRRSPMPSTRRKPGRQSLSGAAWPNASCRPGRRATRPTRSEAVDCSRQWADF